ncbi:MAG: hypothetical protein RL421_964, partial [Actinomycetota bacterium]
VLSALLFIIVAIATPITRVTAYAAFFALIFLAILIAKLPIKTVATRSLIEIPFVLFAFLMPFFGTGEKVELFGLSLYEEGLIAGAGIIAKGTLGILTAIVLSSTTTARELLRGLETLRVPTLIIQIATFMLRYMNVVNDEMERMRIAGALFIRSYERGERVHLAMVSRGYVGSMPQDHRHRATRQELLQGFSLPILAALISLSLLVIG